MNTPTCGQRHRSAAVRHATTLTTFTIVMAGALFSPTQAAPRTALTRPQAQDVLASLPLRFEANNGVMDQRVKFLSHGPGYTLFLTSTEAVMSLQRAGAGEKLAGRTVGWKDGRKSLTPNTQHPAPDTAVLRMKLVNSNPNPTVQGMDEMKAKSNYFFGSDPKGWRTDVTQYQKVRYSSVYPGIDLVYYGNGKQLEYDFIVKPGADPRKIGLDVQGADELSIDGAGNLVVHTAGGSITWKKPTLYQEVNGVRKPIEGHYIIHAGRVGQGSRRVSFAVASYDRNHALTIDPALAYSTYMGGNSYDYAASIAVDSSGMAYIAGTAQSPVGAGGIPFPTVGAAQSTNAGSVDAFVSKIDTTKSGAASLVYSTYLGGSGDDFAYGIAVDNSGNAYITGSTTSYNAIGTTAFPTTTGALLTGNSSGATKAFVAKFDTTKTGAASLIYSTYLGGSSIDTGNAIAIDSSGIVYVTGFTTSSTAGGGTAFPTTAGALQTTYGGSYDAFLTKLDTTKSGIAALLYSTYLGGNGLDFGFGVAVDSSGIVYLTGYSSSTSAGGGTAFPTTPSAFQLTKNGIATGYDSFVTKIDTTKAGAAGLIYSTYLGGSSDDDSQGITVDNSGIAYITGYTSSKSAGGGIPFPTTAGAFQPTLLGIQNAFVTKLDTTKSGAAGLIYSTYLGGSGSEEGHGIAIDSLGKIYLVGLTTSRSNNGGTAFPTSADALQPLPGATSSDSDAYVTKLDPSKSGAASLIYSTYLGGNGAEKGLAIALDHAGNAYVAGLTISLSTPGNTPFPTTPNALQSADAGSYDAFMSKISGLFTVSNDFNGDGYPDLVVQSSSAQQVAFWFTNGANITGGAYALSGGGPITLPTNWQVVATGDFNGDGTTDLVVNNTSTGQIAFWFTNGTSVTGGAYATSGAGNIGVPSGWQIVGSGDFNGDGKPDLVLQNPTSQTIAVWLMNGTNVSGGVYVTSGGSNPITLPAGWQIVGVGDFNSDGHPDLVLDNPSSGQIAVWLMSGTAVTSGVYVTNGGNPIPLPAGWQIAAIGDFSGDGKPDLVLENLSNRQLAFWYLNGTALSGSSYALAGSIPFGMPAGWQVNGPR